MEISDKIIKPIIGLIFLALGNVAIADDLSLPKDLPTIEVLVELHKQMRKNEDASLEQHLLITGQQEIITHTSGKINDVKSTLNSKLNDVNSYLLLASSISNTCQNLAYLIDELRVFTTVTGPIVIMKPYTAPYYYNTITKVDEAVGKLSQSIAGFTIGMNIWKASIQEKFKLLSFIDASVSKIRNILHSSSNYIRYSTRRDIIIKSVRDIWPDEFRSTLTNDLIDKWNQNKNKL